MIKREHETIENQIIELDDTALNRCKVNKCGLVYSGGEQPIMTHCEFKSPTFMMRGAAQRTLDFMKNLRAGGGEGVVERWISYIRGEGVENVNLANIEPEGGMQ